MSKKQIITLILGCVLLIAGFYVLIRMTQVDNVFSLDELFTKNTSQEAAVQTDKTEEVAGVEETEQSGFDRLLQKIVDLNIPIWGYVVIFLVLVVAIRFYSFQYEIKSARRSMEMRQAAETAAESSGINETNGPPEND
jgi:uncharacterized membrane protein YraQ (UPF0718 family)